MSAPKPVPDRFGRQTCPHDPRTVADRSTFSQLRPVRATSGQVRTDHLRPLSAAPLSRAADSGQVRPGRWRAWGVPVRTLADLWPSHPKWYTGLRAWD
jgi:hypothetical protein